ncbi:MAG: cell wall metabolism sensor histidine kinase WalK [Clostridiaceae bacterium]|nr:cell wall metabolism sensor histidine kinase WalK [Clostridiaceae bacterium]
MSKLRIKSAFFRSIQWRLVIILVLVTFILMTVVWVFLNMQVESIFYRDFKNNIETNYKALGINGDDITIDQLLSILQSNPVISGVIRGEDRSFTVIDKDTGEIVYSSDELYQIDKLRFRNLIYKSENLMSVLSGASPSGDKQAYTRVEEGDFYDYAFVQSLEDGDYILFFKYGRQKALTVLNRFSEVIFWSLLSSVFAALLIGLALSRTITRPIYDIMHKVEKITDGEFGYALEVKSDDELGKLTKTFNFMSSRLKQMLAEITSEKKKVETILNYMTDGIIAFNRYGDVIHTNPASKSILSEDQVDSMTFNEFMNRLDIPLSIEEINEIQAIPAPNHKVKYNDKYIRIHLASFTDEENKIDGIVTVIQDITEEHRLDKMRREFVANVSHELRTPLTSVKSYTETLLDGALKEPTIVEHFLEVINDETDRMTRLVKDLLTLSQHDGGVKLNLEDISIADLVSSCVERLRREAEIKNQNLKLTVMKDIPIIQGDRYRIDQLLINIIGNAIKYTPEKGRIHVKVYVENEYVKIRVEDNGIGIPEEDLGRVFERFYRVDKARSRQLGGTGLGLAIAKEIALLHGGDIYIRSKVGKGTQLTVELPVRSRPKQHLIAN